MHSDFSVLSTFVKIVLSNTNLFFLCESFCLLNANFSNRFFKTTNDFSNTKNNYFDCYMLIFTCVRL